MIKVLVIGYSNNKGGVETFIKNVFTNMNRDNMEFHFTTSQPIGNNYEVLLESGAIIHDVIENRHNPIKYYKFWTKFFKENKFDVIYYNTCDIVSIDMLIFAKKAGVNTRIIHSHSSGIQFELNAFHKIEERCSRRMLKKYVTNFWACSDVAGRWMFGNRKYKIIKNGINLERFHFNETLRNKKRQEFKLTDEDKVIVLVGRIEDVKDPLRALNIIEQYSLIRKNIKLFYVGTGVLEDTLKNEISNKNLNNVSVLGSRDDVAEIMMASDVFLMTSKFEGLPFVLVEAQATGLPCVVIDNVSSESKITDLVEFVEKDADLDIWASKLDAALSRKIDREDYSAIVANEGFDIRNTAKMIEDFIKKNVYEKNN